MKTILISIIYTMARKYFDRDLFERIEALVRYLIDQEYTGSEKRQKVKDALMFEFADVRGIVIDTIIQIVLLKAGAVGSG